MQRSTPVRPLVVGCECGCGGGAALRWKWSGRRGAQRKMRMRDMSAGQVRQCDSARNAPNLTHRLCTAPHSLTAAGTAHRDQHCGGLDRSDALVAEQKKKKKSESHQFHQQSMTPPTNRLIIEWKTDCQHADALWNLAPAQKAFVFRTCSCHFFLSCLFVCWAHCRSLIRHPSASVCVKLDGMLAVCAWGYNARGADTVPDHCDSARSLSGAGPATASTGLTLSATHIQPATTHTHIHTSKREHTRAVFRHATQIICWWRRRLVRIHTRTHSAARSDAGRDHATMQSRIHNCVQLCG